MTRRKLADREAFIERSEEIRTKVESLYAELTFCRPETPDWVRVTRAIEQSDADLRACEADFEAYLRGEAS